MNNASGTDEFSVQFLLWMNAELRRHIEEEAATAESPGLLQRTTGFLAAGATAIVVWVVSLTDF